MKKILKKQLIAALCIVMALTFAGCSILPITEITKGSDASTSEVSTDKPEKIKPQASTDPEPEPEPEPEPVDFDPAIYDEILMHSYLILSENETLQYGEDYLEGATWLYDSQSIANVYERLDSYGYIIEDISGDGVPELIIGSTPNEYEEYCSVVNIYTVKDGKPFLVDEGWGRSRLYLLDDNSVYTEGSASAFSYCFGRYMLSKDATEKEWSDFYFSDEDASGDLVYFHNTIGEWNRAISDKISYNEFEANDLTGAETKIRKIPYNLFTTLSTVYAKPVDCAFYVYEDDGYSGFEKYHTIDDVDILDFYTPVDVRFVAKADVERFSFVRLSYMDIDDINSFSADVEYTIGNVTKYNGFVLEYTFTESLPMWGFSYFDLAGNERIFGVTQSGKDGSVQIIQLQ